MTVFSDSSDDI